MRRTTTILFWHRFICLIASLVANLQLVAPSQASARISEKQLRTAPVHFESRAIRIKNKIISVEIADSLERRTYGLMFREILAKDRGMLFIFDEEQSLAFWMKNTLIPLSMGFFDRNKILVDIQEMVPAIAGDAHPPVYKSIAPAQYALEMPKGWFAAHRLSAGARFEFVDKK